MHLIHPAHYIVFVGTREFEENRGNMMVNDEEKMNVKILLSGLPSSLRKEHESIDVGLSEDRSFLSWRKSVIFPN